MKKPVIGISANVLDIEKGPFTGCRRSFVNEDYVKAVIEAGAIPVIIPMTDDIEVIEYQVHTLDGLLLTGGQDVHPREYGELPSDELEETSTERDNFDRTLVKAALERQIPILGICRGHQILNVVAGGSLYQDLGYIEHCSIAHNQFKSEIPEPHRIKTEKNSLLNSVLGDHISVNSFHHLAVKDLAPEFKATAISEDGVVEGIEHTSHPFIVGVQWHPEELSVKGDTRMKSLFKEMVHHSAEIKESRKYRIAI